MLRSRVSRVQLVWRRVSKSSSTGFNSMSQRANSVFPTQSIRYIQSSALRKNNDQDPADSQNDAESNEPTEAPTERHDQNTPTADSETTNETPEDTPIAKTPEQIKAERKARKEKKKKNKQSKLVIEEDDVEQKKRLRKELNMRMKYEGDGSEIDPKSDDLNDKVIIERINKLYKAETNLSLRKLKHKLEKENARFGAIYPAFRYWDEFDVPHNPYTRIRFNQAYSKWANRDLRQLSNEDYQNLKYNTLARMNATVANYEIFPDVLKKFTPTINLIAEFNDPIARDILVYYGNIIPARFTENKPKIKFTGRANSLYTLLLVDAKNTAYLEEYGQSIQWMITNIPGDGDLSKGDELVEYFGATPLKEFGPNRMVFLLFRQAEGRLQLDFDPIKETEFLKREPFDVQEFAIQHELLPRGLTFFTCPYDNTVPSRFEAVGFGEPQFIREQHIRRKEARKARRDVTREGTAKKWTWLDQQEYVQQLLEEQPEETHTKE